MTSTSQQQNIILAQQQQQQEYNSMSPTTNRDIDDQNNLEIMNSNNLNNNNNFMNHSIDDNNTNNNNNNKREKNIKNKIGLQNENDNDTKMMETQQNDSEVQLDHILNDNCAICLQKMHKPSLLEPCYHTFCEPCLYRWFDINRVCPLCLLKPKQLICDIRSIHEFQVVNCSDDQQKIEQSQYEKLYPGHAKRQEVYSRSYTCQYDPHIHRRRFSDSPQFLSPDRSSVPCSRQINLGLSNEYFFRIFNEPTAQHEADRLRSWIERDLQAILKIHDVSLILEFVLQVLKETPIESETTVNALNEYLTPHTEHFLQELHMFARSVFTMSVYDQNTVYISEPNRLMRTKRKIDDTENNSLEQPENKRLRKSFL